MRKMMITMTLAIAAAASFGTAALAGPQCTSEAASTWLSEAEMQEKIKTAGVTIEVFKTTKGNCYEIYGRNAEGKRVEIYYHPVTGDIVKQEEV